MIYSVSVARPDTEIVLTGAPVFQGEPTPPPSEAWFHAVTWRVEPLVCMFIPLVQK